MLPDVWDEAHRIQRVAKLLNKPLIDLHNYPDGRQCLIRTDKFLERFPCGVPLPQFFDLLKSHFYWEAYVENYNKEPWPGEAHGWDENELQQWMQEQLHSMTK